MNPDQEANWCGTSQKILLTSQAIGLARNAMDIFTRSSAKNQQTMSVYFATSARLLTGEHQGDSRRPRSQVGWRKKILCCPLRMVPSSTAYTQPSPYVGAMVGENVQGRLQGLHQQNDWEEGLLTLFLFFGWKPAFKRIAKRIVGAELLGYPPPVLTHI